MNGCREQRAFTAKKGRVKETWDPIRIVYFPLFYCGFSTLRRTRFSMEPPMGKLHLFTPYSTYTGTPNGAVREAIELASTKSGGQGLGSPRSRPQAPREIHSNRRRLGRSETVRLDGVDGRMVQNRLSFRRR